MSTLYFVVIWAIGQKFLCRSVRLNRHIIWRQYSSHGRRVEASGWSMPACAVRPSGPPVSSSSKVDHKLNSLPTSVGLWHQRGRWGAWAQPNTFLRVPSSVHNHFLMQMFSAFHAEVQAKSLKFSFWLGVALLFCRRFHRGVLAIVDRTLGLRFGEIGHDFFV